MRYHPTKQDSNHRPIVQELEARGIEVVEVFEPLDLLVFKNGFTGWIEVKVPKSRAVYTRKQIKFIAETRMPVCIAQNAPDALEFVKTGQGLTNGQKDALTQFLMRDDRKIFHREIIERTLKGLPG